VANGTSRQHGTRDNPAGSSDLARPDRSRRRSATTLQPGSARHEPVGNAWVRATPASPSADLREPGRGRNRSAVHDWSWLPVKACKPPTGAERGVVRAGDIYRVAARKPWRWARARPVVPQQREAIAAGGGAIPSGSATADDSHGSGGGTATGSAPAVVGHAISKAAISGVRHRTGRIARFVARTGNMAGIN